MNDLLQHMVDTVPREDPQGRVFVFCMIVSRMGLLQPSSTFPSNVASHIVGICMGSTVYLREICPVTAIHPSRYPLYTNLCQS